MIVNYNLSRIYSDDWRTHVENTFFFFSAVKDNIFCIFFFSKVIFDIWKFDIWQVEGPAQEWTLFYQKLLQK